MEKKIYKSYYWFYPEENLKFSSRLEAKLYLGHALFNKLNREGKIYFVGE